MSGCCDKTGKVTISRKGERSMAAAVWLHFAKWFLIYFALFAAMTLPVIFLVEEVDLGAEMFLVDAVFSLAIASSAAFPCIGTLVETVVFDYDAKQVAVVKSNLFGRKREVSIPFHRFHFHTKDNGLWYNIYYTGNRAKGRSVLYYFYDMNYKEAVLGSRSNYGWDEESVRLLNQELEGFYIKK